MDADGQGSVSFLIQGSSKLIHLTAGRVNGLWNFVGLVPPTFFLELIPHARRRPHFKPNDRLHGYLGLPFGDHDSLNKVEQMA